MNNKDIWIVSVATLSLIVSVVIPFASRKYDQWKAKVSFELYLKKYLGVVFNILTYDRLEYHEPSIKDNPEKRILTLTEFIRQFNRDYTEHKNTLQPRVGFHLLLNLQYLILTSYRVQSAILQAEINKMYEQTLANGCNLSRKELNKIYGLLLLMEHFGSLLNFHDRFDKMLVVKRTVKDNQWMGMKLDGDILKNQQLIAQDLKHIVNEEQSVMEIIKILTLLIQQFKEYYEYDKLKRLKTKSQSAQSLLSI